MDSTVWTGLLALMNQYPWTLDFSGHPCCCLPLLYVLGLRGPQLVGTGRHCLHHLASFTETLHPRCWAQPLLVQFVSISNWEGARLLKKVD